MATKERKIMTELIELYCEFPCLWDMSSEIYKDKKQKAEAWYLLTKKLAELEPDATVVCTKKKIEHLRTAYQREARKVQASKRNNFDPNEVYIPTLWYFKLLSSILGKDEEEGKSEVEPLGSEEESQEPERVVAKTNSKAMLKKHRDRVLERKKLKFIQAKQELQQQTKQQETYNNFLTQCVSKRSNTFVAYVEEQLDQVGMFQRNVAEKLISEVLFLAKTGHLTFDTTISIPSNPRGFFPSSNNSFSQSVSSQMIQPNSPQSNDSGSSPQHIVSCPSFQYLQSSSPAHSVSSQIAQLSDPTPIEQDAESPNKSVLKELLILKKPK